MRVLRQIARGCGDLPHVGPHPGTAMLGIFIAMGVVAGWHGGLVGMAGGAAVMVVVFGPMYLYGAYDRANLSDRLSDEESI